MASKRPDSIAHRLAVAAALALGPGSAAASELFLCGASGTGPGAAGFVNLVGEPANPPAPPDGVTEACMPVLSFDGNVFVAAGAGGGGGGGGNQLRGSRITVVLPRNVNAARLTQLVGTGAVLSNLTLVRTVRAPGTGAFRLADAIALAQVQVASIQTSAAAGSGQPTDVLTLDFDRIRWATWPDPLATPLPAPATACWKFASNAPC